MKLLNFSRNKVPTLIRQAGFTMIELLVVISVIGVLAVAVLSSINPIEQINKGRDTRTRSDAAQLINAIDRYFAIQEEYPWNTEAGDEFWQEYDLTPAQWDTPADAWADRLVDTAEVKGGFISRVRNEARIYIYKDGGATSDTNATIFSCFQPVSRAFQLEAIKRCGEGDSDDPGYPPRGTVCSQGGVGAYDVDTPYDDEYICLP